MDLFQNNNSGAEFSECRKYRYALWRIWDESKPLVMIIGLNPSTADEVEPDPTIESVGRITRNWGCGGFYMMNLFAIISSKPEVLLTCEDPLGDNEIWLTLISQKCERVIFAWGGFKEAKKRSADVIARFPNAYALKIIKDGSPRHPLYLKGNTIPFLFNQPQTK